MWKTKHPETYQVTPERANYSTCPQSNFYQPWTSPNNDIMPKTKNKSHTDDNRQLTPTDVDTKINNDDTYEEQNSERPLNATSILYCTIGEDCRIHNHKKFVDIIKNKEPKVTITAIQRETEQEGNKPTPIQVTKKIQNTKTKENSQRQKNSPQKSDPMKKEHVQAHNLKELRNVWLWHTPNRTNKTEQYLKIHT